MFVIEKYARASFEIALLLAINGTLEHADTADEVNANRERRLIYRVTR